MIKNKKQCIQEKRLYERMITLIKNMKTLGQ